MNEQETKSTSVVHDLVCGLIWESVGRKVSMEPEVRDTFTLKDGDDDWHIPNYVEVLTLRRDLLDPGSLYPHDLFEDWQDSLWYLDADKKLKVACFREGGSVVDICPPERPANNPFVRLVKTIRSLKDEVRSIN
jgi:hypothetical protein